jgi:hypothetical protein
VHPGLLFYFGGYVGKSKYRFRCCPSLLAMTVLVTNAAAGNIYVDSILGDDDNDGGSGDPLATITEAINQAVSGDVIHVVGGTSPVRYYDFGTDETFPLRLKHGISIMGTQSTRAAWPRIGGDVAGVADALMLIEASDTYGDRLVGTVSRLLFLGEDEVGVDSPIPLRVLAIDGNQAGIVFEDNVCTTPYMNASGSNGLATIHVTVEDGSLFETGFIDNSIACSDRGGLEIIVRAGDDDIGSTFASIHDNYFFTESGATALFGVQWRAVDLEAETPEHANSINIDRNVIGPMPGGDIVDGIRIVCEEHTRWGSQGMSENVIDGCSGNGLTLISDGWESSTDAEITIISRRNVIVNNGESGVVLIWDPTNHGSDLGYGYIHFNDEGSLVAANGDYGFELRGIGENTTSLGTTSDFRLMSTTVADNAGGGLGFFDLALGETDPENEMAEVVALFVNCIMYGNALTTTGVQVDGIDNLVLDAVLSVVWHSNWEGHPLAVYTPCDQDSGDQDVIDCDPDFVDSGNGDYHLMSSSPCIDTGDNSHSNALFDLGQTPRVHAFRVEAGSGVQTIDFVVGD